MYNEHTLYCIHPMTTSALLNIFNLRISVNVINNKL